MIFDSYIQGIPCQIYVTTNARPVPSNRTCDPGHDPYDPGCFEFEVLDRKGYPAEWLERKMTEDDVARIEHEAGHERHDAAICAAEMRAEIERENWEEYARGEGSPDVPDDKKTQSYEEVTHGA